jgi:hypothetical protein
VGKDAEGRDLWGYAQVWDDIDPSFSGLLCNSETPSPFYPEIPPQQNQFGGYSGNIFGVYSNPIPGGPPPVVNQFGGYSANEGYLPYTNQGIYPNQNQFGGGIAQLLTQEQSGVNGVSPYVGNLIGQVVSAGGSEFNSANSNKESTKLEENIESQNSASGQNFGAIGGLLNGGFGLGGKVVSAVGNAFNTANSNSESTKFNQNKESSGSSSGQHFGINGVTNGGLYGGEGFNQGVSGERSAIKEANSEKSESTKIQQNKEVSSSSSGQVSGALNKTPIIAVPLQQVNSAGGTQFQNSNAQKGESTSLHQEKESAFQGSLVSGRDLRGFPLW